MKKVLPVILVSISASVLAYGSESSHEFLSWYDGWGTHTVWGVGKIQAGYAGVSIKCGSEVIPVRAVYDTHANLGEAPASSQSQAHAEAANVSLLHVVEARGDKCVLSHEP